MENMRNCTQCSQDKENCKDWTIAMAYVPWQNMEQLNEPAQALRTGTLFPELEKPFRGSMRKGARR